MNPEFYAFSFAILIIVAHWAINLVSALLYPKSNQCRRERARADHWEPLRYRVHLQRRFLRKTHELF